VYGKSSPTFAEDELFGIEIEMEGLTQQVAPAHYQPGGLAYRWVPKPDSSLRNSGIEFITTSPVSWADAQSMVKGLYTACGRSNADSMRAGVHVHRNVERLTYQQVATVLTAYWILEAELIDQYCGAERAGNLFCLRILDAANPLNYFITSLSRKGVSSEPHVCDSLKYGAVNLGAIPRFNSLEFRSLRTPTTAAPILAWVAVIERVFQHTLASFHSPIEVTAQFSDQGPEAFCRSYFEGLVINPDRVIRALRLVQELAYTTNWGGRSQ